MHDALPQYERGLLLLLLLTALIMMKIYIFRKFLSDLPYIV